ncbi:MAG: type IV secretion system DNA-binding domain-containing protein [Chloroflexi bacterium]|nr:type IV secretion system DNA-binding domain-containing protein [Chloroflexota bacterium]
MGRSGRFPFSARVRLSAAERTTHLYVIGLTGQGKSKFLQHGLFQDITAGRGCGVLDPHTDLVHDLMAQLAQAGFFNDPAQRRRVIYLDPARRDGLIPFNVLASSEAPYTTAINVIEAFRRTWPESLREAPRFTNILLASLLVLIANRQTLVELPRLLTDKPFREALLAQVDDPELVSVFHDRLDRWGREEPLILESLLNKVSALALNPSLRRSLGQRENQLDFRRIMDDGRILLINLGRCDSETRRLLGSLMVTFLEQAALSRADTPAQARRPFYFYLDEFQDFCANEGSTTSLARILSESRKFGLHLTLAHQTLGQLASEPLRAALGNIGTQLVFAVDRPDAERLAKQLFSVGGERIKHEVQSETHQPLSHPVYYSLPEEWERAIQRLQNLPPRSGWVKTPRRRHAIRLQTIPLPPRHLSDEALEALCTALSRPSGWSVTGRGARPQPPAPAPPAPTTYYEPLPGGAMARQGGVIFQA